MERQTLTACNDPLRLLFEYEPATLLLRPFAVGSALDPGSAGGWASAAEAALPETGLAVLTVLAVATGYALFRHRARRRAGTVTTPMALPAPVAVSQATPVLAAPAFAAPPPFAWRLGYPLLRHHEQWQPGTDETGLWHAWRRPRPVALTTPPQGRLETSDRALPEAATEVLCDVLTEDAPGTEALAPAPALSWAGLQAELDHKLGPGHCVLMVEAGVGSPYLWVSDATQIDDILLGMDTQLREMPPALVLLLKAQLLLQQAGEPRTAPATVSACLARANAAIGAGLSLGPTALDTEWPALALRLDLLQLHQQGTASRLLGLRQLAARCTALEHQPLPVLRAALDILFYCASQQQGEVALQRYADAERLCLRMQEDPALRDEGMRLQAETLLRQAARERPGQRGAVLDRAQRLADAAHARSPGSARALTVAEIALARARSSEGAQAEQALDHALWHAFTAGTDPQLYAAALQVRLAVQSTHGGDGTGSSVDDATLRLSQELVSFPHLAATTFVELAQVQLRHHRYAQCCTLCAEAAQQGRVTAALLRTWAEGSQRWAEQAHAPDERAAWQRNARARQFAVHH